MTTTSTWTALTALDEVSSCSRLTRTFFPLSPAPSSAALGFAQLNEQPNPCDRKSRVVGDITYCDRYWQCVAGTPQLYDCPNGLVFVGRNRGIAEGCDYPWRGAYCDNKQLASKFCTREPRC